MEGGLIEEGKRSKDIHVRVRGNQGLSLKASYTYHLCPRVCALLLASWTIENIIISDSMQERDVGTYLKLPCARRGKGVLSICLVHRSC